MLVALVLAATPADQEMMPLDLRPHLMGRLQQQQQQQQPHGGAGGAPSGCVENIDYAVLHNGTQIAPPGAPDPDEGFELLSSPWRLLPLSETRSCHATWYNVTASVPINSRRTCNAGGSRTVPCATTAGVRHFVDSGFHHSIVRLYIGPVPPEDAAWGTWRCSEGARKGQACQPRATNDCGTCQRPRRRSDGMVVQQQYACICATEHASPAASAHQCPDGGYASSTKWWEGQSMVFLEVAQGSCRPNEVDDSAVRAGAYRSIPTEGLVIWESHGINPQATTVEAQASERISYVPSSAAKHEVRTTEARTHARCTCTLSTLFYALASQAVFAALAVVQVHSTSQLWYPHHVLPYTNAVYCNTIEMPSRSTLVRTRSHSHQWTTRFETWLPPNQKCAAECLSCPLVCGRDVTREPEYISTTPSEPSILWHDPPLDLGADGAEEGMGESAAAAREARTLKSCVHVDNGKSRPKVLRNSEMKELHGMASAMCVGAAYCFWHVQNEGNNGESGVSERAAATSTKETRYYGDDDSICGDAGVCDACPIVGGASAWNEMFMPISDYYMR